MGRKRKEKNTMKTINEISTPVSLLYNTVLNEREPIRRENDREEGDSTYSV